MKKTKLFAILSLIIFAISCNPTNNNVSNNKKENVSQNITKDTNNMIKTQNAFTEVYKNTHESIVNIRTKKTVTVNSFNPLEALLFGHSGNRQETRESGSLGSGFVISEDGYIITNNHVIDGADEIYVKFSNGNEYLTKLVGTSPEVDIALLKIDSKDTFKPLEFADSDQIQIGQWSIAFGNPLGLNDSMTVGVVSASGRSSLGIEEIENFIQTDAAINQGNSGGPLIDINGKVIGVNTAIFSQSGGSIGLGFAIPSNLVVAVKDSLISNGSFVKPYLGIHLSNLNEEIIKDLKLKSTSGIFIGKVVPNSPAERAGLKENDVITAIDGKSISNSGAFIGELSAKKIGQNVEFTVIRNSKQISVNVILEKNKNIFN